MNIRVDLNTSIKDGTEVIFRSPVDCSQVTGLKVYYIGDDGNTTSMEFAFADAHGNNVGNIDHLFAENVAVKVILDVTTSMAFVQNADTNAYLEGRFAETIDKCCPAFTESGPIVTCEPVEGYPLEVVSKIEMLQEGSGDPSPGGSLVNLDDGWKDNNSWTEEYVEGQTRPYRYYYNLNYYLPAGQYTYTVTNGSYREGVLVELEANTSPVAWEIITTYPAPYPNGIPEVRTIPFTMNASYTIRLAVRAENPLPDSINIYEDVVKEIALYSGSAPNIRPIVGHTAAELTHYGKNLLSEDWKSFKNYTNNQNLVLSLPKGKYVVSAEKTDTTYLYLQRSTDGGVSKELYARLHTNTTQTVNSIAFEVTGAEGEMWMLWTSNQKYLDAIKWVQIECGDVATSYEPYMGKTITAELGQTVYGGTYNWETGELTLDKALVSLDGSECSYYKSSPDTITGCSCFTLSSLNKAVGFGTSLCSHFRNTNNPYPYTAGYEEVGTYTDHSANAYIYFDWGTADSTPEEFSAWLKEQHDAGTPVELCYMLAEPITIQATPNEVLALQGINTLSSNTGDTTVNGKADPTAIIEKLTNAIIALGGNV